jgi:hypothetical protein
VPLDAVDVGDLAEHLQPVAELLAPEPQNSVKAGNTKWRSTTVPLTSCLTGLDLAV